MFQIHGNVRAQYARMAEHVLTGSADIDVNAVVDILVPGAKKVGTTF